MKKPMTPPAMPPLTLPGKPPPSDFWVGNPNPDASGRGVTLIVPVPTGPACSRIYRQSLARDADGIGVWVTPPRLLHICGIASSVGHVFLIYFPRRPFQRTTTAKAVVYSVGFLTWYPVAPLYVFLAQVFLIEPFSRKRPFVQSGRTTESFHHARANLSRRLRRQICGYSHQHGSIALHIVRWR